MDPSQRRLKRLLTPPLMVAAVLLVLFEEHLWRWLTGTMARLGRLPAVARVEARIAALPPYWAACAFALPAAAMLPFKLAALWAIAQGQVALGLLVILAAKLVGTALVARLYVLCRPSLVTVAWIARLVDWAERTKAWAHAKLEASAAWRLARRLTGRAKASLRQSGTLTRRWRSIRRRAN